MDLFTWGWRGGSAAESNGGSSQKPGSAPISIGCLLTVCNPSSRRSGSSSDLRKPQAGTWYRSSSDSRKLQAGTWYT